MPYIPVYYKTTLPTLHPSKLIKEADRVAKTHNGHGRMLMVIH